MCCLVASLAFIGRRFVLLVIWIFGDRVDLVFSSRQKLDAARHVRG